MIDIKLLRTELEETSVKLERRSYQLDKKGLSALEARRKEVQVRTQELQSRRNASAKEIGKAKAAEEDTASLMAAVANFGDELKQAEAELDDIQEQLSDVLLGIPNLAHESVPHGQDENDNVEVRRWGEAPAFDFEPKDHTDLGVELGLLDFETGAKLACSRFVTMTGQLVRLHRALTQFMIDLHVQEHGYTEIYVPYMVNSDTLRGTGHYPSSRKTYSA